MQGQSDPDRELLDAAALVGHLVPPDTVHGFLAEHRLRLFGDELFADLFPSRRGRPSVPADVIATVLVLQALEGLSDRDALRALVTDIRWKVACGLALDDEGFHPTVLTLWRNKLRASDAPERIFDVVREVIAETGLLAGKARRALDSTLLDDAVATQDTVTQLSSMIRRVRQAVPAAASVELVGDDYDTAAKPVCAWNDPAARDDLVSRLVNDAITILDAVDDVELDANQSQLVGLLALVAGQDVEPDPDGPDGPDGSWRIERGVAKHRIVSTVDPESRHMHKSRSVYRDGYKAHIAVEPDTGIITACDLTPANAGDGPAGVGLLAEESAGLEVLVDSAYGSGDTLAELEAGGHQPVIKPWSVPKNPRLGHDQFVRDDFVFDYDARTVTCPNGVTKHISVNGYATFGVKCRGCPVRHRCTAAASGKTVHVTKHDRLLAANRQGWRDNEQLVADYKQHRPHVERGVAHLVANNHRRVRFRGVEANKLALTLRVAAINLRRAINLGLSHNGTAWNIA